MNVKEEEKDKDKEEEEEEEEEEESLPGAVDDWKGLECCLLLGGTHLQQQSDSSWQPH